MYELIELLNTLKALAFQSSAPKKIPTSGWLALANIFQCLCLRNWVALGHIHVEWCLQHCSACSILFTGKSIIQLLPSSSLGDFRFWFSRARHHRHRHQQKNSNIMCSIDETLAFMHHAERQRQQNFMCSAKKRANTVLGNFTTKNSKKKKPSMCAKPSKCKIKLPIVVVHPPQRWKYVLEVGRYLSQKCECAHT
jgi:hypothetical protein